MWKKDIDTGASEKHGDGFAKRIDGGGIKKQVIAIVVTVLLIVDVSVLTVMLTPAASAQTGVPTISVSVTGSSGNWTVSATDNNAGTTTMKYKLTNGNGPADCNAAAMSSASNYTEGTEISFTSPWDNGKTVCFSSTNATGTGYGGGVLAQSTGGAGVAQAQTQGAQTQQSGWNSANWVSGVTAAADRTTLTVTTSRAVYANESVTGVTRGNDGCYSSYLGFSVYSSYNSSIGYILVRPGGNIRHTVCDLPASSSQATRSFTIRLAGSLGDGYTNSNTKLIYDADSNNLRTSGLIKLSSGTLAEIDDDVDADGRNISFTNTPPVTNPPGAPTATISGAPTGQTTDAIDLYVTVGGTGVTHYKHKVVEGTSCSSNPGYSSETVVSQKIDETVGNLQDGTITLCVIGKNSSNVWQSAPTTASWTKDTNGGGTTPPDNTPVDPTVLNVVPASTGYYGNSGVTTKLDGKYGLGQDIYTKVSFTKEVKEVVSNGSSARPHISYTIGNTDTRYDIIKTGTLRSGDCKKKGTSTANKKIYVCLYTVNTDDTGSFGLKVGTATQDKSNNNLATEYVHTAADDNEITLDPTRPTISTVKANGATLIVTTSEKVYATSTPQYSNFRIVNSNNDDSDVTVRGITGLARTRATADNSFTLTLSGTLTTGDKLAYTRSITTSRRIKDEANNTMDSLASNKTITDIGTSTAVFSPADGGYLKKGEEGQDITISFSGKIYSDDDCEGEGEINNNDVRNIVVLKRGSKNGSNIPNGSTYASSTGSTITINPTNNLTDGKVYVGIAVVDANTAWYHGTSTSCTKGTTQGATFTVDTVAPTASVSGTPTGTNNTETLNATVSGTGVTHYKYAVFNETTELTCSNINDYSEKTAVTEKITADISGVGDGNVALCVKGIDAAGNEQTDANATKRTWVKDTTVENATVSGAPSGTNNVTVLNVTVSGTGITHYKHKVVTGTTCTNGGYGSERQVATKITDNITSLADGDITLCVLGRDTVGNYQSSAEVHNWIKDTSVSSATISGAPTGDSKDTELNVTVSGDDIEDYKHKIVRGKDCSSGAYGSDITLADNNKITTDFSSYSDGQLTLCVLAKDTTGNWQPTATKATWMKDTQSPTATITGAPSGRSNTTALDVTIGGGDTDRYRYKVLAGTACGSNDSGYGGYTAVATKITHNISSAPADGNVVLCVLGMDAAGNKQTTPTKVSWVKDTVAPTAASISGAPTDTSNTTTLNVTVSGNDITHYKHKVIAGTSCSTGTYGSERAVATKITDNIGTTPVDGPVILCVLGRDAAGNYQSTATQARWTKDASVAATTLSGAPSGTNNDTVLNVTVGGTDVSHYKYKVVAGTTCTTGGYSTERTKTTKITDSITSLADGNIVLCVLGRDSTNNWQDTATKATWTKDTQAPTASLTGAPTGTNDTTELDITVGGTGVTHYKHKVVTGTSCSTGNYGSKTTVATDITDDIAYIADGTLSICVIGMDAAGNEQSDPTKKTWNKNTTAATAIISGAPTGTNATTTLNVQVGGTDVVSYKHKVVEGTSCSIGAYSTETVLGTRITDDISGLADGNISLCVIGKNAIGNWQRIPTKASWVKDAIAEPVTLDGVPKRRKQCNDTGCNGKRY